MYVHEACCFNINVAGQIAVAKSLPDAFDKEYRGHKNYLEYTQSTFEEARNEVCNLVKRSKRIKIDPVACESGYFVTADISTTRDLIPERYFKPNVNYEDDKDTLVKQMQFIDGKVPLDFALCRWLAIEKGVVIMPLSNFCLQESPHKMTNMVRIASCKTPETFTDPKLISKFDTL